MKMVAEGVLTTKAVHQLRLKYSLEMPIHEAMFEILFMDKNPKDSVYELMNRKLSNEHKKMNNSKLFNCFNYNFFNQVL